MMPQPYRAGSRITIAPRALLFALTLLLAWPAAGQDNAPPDPPGIAYATEIEAPDSERIAALARAVAQTVTLRERAPTDGIGLLARVRADLPRLQDLLRAEGHWGGSVAATLAGRPLDDPALPTLLQEARDPVPVRIILTPGPLYRIGRLSVAADPAAAEPVLQQALSAASLAEGDPARAEAVLAAEGAVRDALRRAGYPLVTIPSRDIVVDHDQHSMDIAWHVAPGPHASFGRPTVSGQVRTNAGLLERTAARRLEGEDYSPARLERARRALLSLGVFDAVRAEPGTALAPGNRLPVNFAVSERPLRAIGGSIAYETNYGLALGLFWEHRNLFGGAERLRLDAEVARLSEGSLSDATYRAFATLTLPEIWRHDARLIARLGAVREILDAYDRNALVASAVAERTLSERLAVQAGPLYETGRIGRYGNLEDFSLLGFLGGLRWDGTTNLLDPSSGQRATLTVTPYWSVEDSNSFTRVLATGSTYFDMTGDASGVLALRAAIGATIGSTRDEIVLDKRFYSGGGGSVRGYVYQSIGPRDSGNRPLGGASLLELGAEWRQRISGPWGAVAFVDAGAVGEDSLPGTSSMRVGVGAGLRYRTTIGPIRVDIGVPLNPERGDPSYALYVGIGQAF